MAIAEAAPAEGFTGGKLLGSVGAGGLALVGTAALVGGIREPKGQSKIRYKLSSTQATLIGIGAGTCYAAAGSIWTATGDLSQAFASIFTGGAFGAAGLGAVSGLLGAFLYFRELSPGRGALAGILAAGVWSQAGGIWGVPEALVLTTAGALGAM
ncbi:hypothetical protein FF041_02125 [Streptomyces jumonjinensis]|uniref:Uncharacterized protein n=2 Tax=Streptomyces jumonjinensis TaxID=1945 RepID=A0A646KA87_STRJU|nr:hypothetical protein [Streptomyces jumonjinensis]